jgi:hypothetical protein
MGGSRAAAFLASASFRCQPGCLPLILAEVPRRSFLGRPDAASCIAHIVLQPSRAARGRLRLLRVESTDEVFFCPPVVGQTCPQWCGLAFQRWNFFEVVFLEGRIDTVGIVIKLNEK